MELSIKHYNYHDIEQGSDEYIHLRNQYYPGAIKQFGSYLGPNQLIIAGGTTGSGKTHVSIAEIVNAIKLGKRVLYIHCELEDIYINHLLKLTGQLKDYTSLDKQLGILYLNDYEQLNDNWEQLLNYDLIIIDYLDVGNLNSEHKQGYEVLQSFMAIVEKVRHQAYIQGSPTCFYIFTQLNGRLTDKVKLSDLNFANCSGLNRKANFSYVMAPTQSYSTSGLSIEVRKDSYGISDNEKFDVEFYYSCSTFGRTLGYGI